MDRASHVAVAERQRLARGCTTRCPRLSLRSRWGQNSTRSTSSRTLRPPARRSITVVQLAEAGMAEMRALISSCDRIAREGRARRSASETYAALRAPMASRLIEFIDAEQRLRSQSRGSVPDCPGGPHNTAKHAPSQPWSNFVSKSVDETLVARFERRYGFRS